MVRRFQRSQLGKADGETGRLSGYLLLSKLSCSRLSRHLAAMRHGALKS